MSRTLLHTRELAIDADPLGGDRLRVRAELHDDRHVDLPGYLGVQHPKGVVHHMGYELELDAELVIRAVSPWMRTIPFEPAPVTRGEGCRNILPGYQSLVGLPLDGSWAVRIFENVGGPAGCFHLLSLGQCLPAAVRMAASRLCGGIRKVPESARPAAVDSCAEWRRESPHWSTVTPVSGSGFRVLRRRIRIEAWANDGVLELEGTLADSLDGEPSTAAVLRLVLGFPGFAIREADARLDRAPFGGCAEALASTSALRALSLTKGFTNAALERVGGSAGCAHVAALLVAITPVTAQAAGALAGHLGLSPMQKLRGRSSNPQADSCHMWRSDGPLMSLATGDENEVK